jgi:hypothetical protein
MYVSASLLAVLVAVTGCSKEPTQPAKEDGKVELSDAEVENLVRRSYQYVAMYNVNSKFAMTQGGWNTVLADTEPKDHTMRDIARPNNDTLYIGCMLDLRKAPVILEMPAFDSDYVSLMVTGYDHYVNVPMATRLGDFEKPEKILFYSERTEGYDGEPAEGVDRIFECTGDFVSAVFRIMPHTSDQERFDRIVAQMKSVKIASLSESRGGKAKSIDDIEFPPVGKTDADVFGNNLLEVMQFVFNHTTFDPEVELDRELLAAYAPLGVVPGKPYDPDQVAKIDGAKIRKASERIFAEEMAKAAAKDKEFAERELFGKFLPKGQMTLELLVFQSVVGPNGLPATEAVYPAVLTTDGKQMNAQNDYVIRMTADELPPTEVFWSLTLYDLRNGFFIPNDRKKYSVGQNAGMKLDENGGIEIYVAAEKPEGVPEENWLPINRKDEDMDIVLRAYVADLEKMKTWTAPKAEKLESAMDAPAKAPEMTDQQIENLVKRSYQHVAMYNVNNKFALKLGGWNTVDADTQLKDHTMREIARPNNDTLYITCVLDLRKDPVILEMPAFDSKYVSLMVTGYDHYVNVPMSTRIGDFKKPEKMLFYTERTEGYDGKPVEGVDRVFECTGDFISAVLRIMPHARDPERFQRIVEEMKDVKITTLAEFRGGKAKPIDDVVFPSVGETDADIFENNLLEVMQFVFNHTTFDPKDPLDQALLAAYKPLGVESGKAWDPPTVAEIDGARFRRISLDVQKDQLMFLSDPEKGAHLTPLLAQPKGRMRLDALVAQSVIGPIGLPAAEAMYPPVAAADGKPMNAQHDYVIRMTKDQMPPFGAFWSLTLYDNKNGFFIPNERKKYSVGENAGMKLDEDGGIEIHVAAEKPEGVPEENWLPINRGDEGIDLSLRVYVPDLEKMKTWTPPKAETFRN